MKRQDSILANFYYQKVPKLPKFQGDKKGSQVSNSEKPYSKSNPEGYVSMKNNQDWFDSHANWSNTGNPEWDAKVRQQIMTGRFGLDPKTGSLIKLPKSEWTNISEEDKRLATDKRQWTSKQKQAGWERQVKPQIVQSTKDLITNPVMMAPGAILTGGMAAGIPAVSRTAAAVMPALETQIGNVPGLTANNLLNAAFAYHGAKNLPNVSNALQTAYNDPTLSNIGTAAGETAITGLDMLPFVASAYKGVPSVIQDVNQAGNYLTTQTPLRNTYKLNPWRFKPNPEAYYHRSPNLENIINRETGMLQGFGQSEAGRLFSETAGPRPGKGINLKKAANSRLYFAKGTPLDWGRTNMILDEKTGKLVPGHGYPGPYTVEVKGVPMGASTKGRAPGEEPTRIGSYAVSKRPISLDEAKFYKEDWLRGYKEVPKPTSLNSYNNDSRLQNFFTSRIANINPVGIFNDYAYGLLKGGVEQGKGLLGELGVLKGAAPRRPFFETFPITKSQKAKVIALQDQALADAKKFTEDYWYGDDLTIRPVLEEKIREILPDIKLAQNTDNLEKLTGPFSYTRDRLIPNTTSRKGREGLDEYTIRYLNANRGRLGGVNDDGVSLTLRNHGLYYKTPREIANTVVHEAGHTGQKFGYYGEPPIKDPNDLFSFSNVRWNDQITKYDPEYGYYTSNPDTELGRRFQEALVSPKKRKLGDPKYTRETWRSSPGELHSELMASKYNMYKQGLSQGLSHEEMMRRVTNPGEKELEWLLNNKFINEHFKKGTPLKEKLDLLKVLPATIPAVIGAAALQNNKEVPQQKKGGIIKDNNGYWNPDNWGKTVEIDSPYITMQGVNQPLIGISDTGDVQYMEPGQDYEFDGSKVTEFPMMQKGGRAPIYTDDPRKVRAYQDSLGLYNSYMSNKELLDKRYKNKPGYYIENTSFPKNPDGTICYNCIKKEAAKSKSYGNFLSNLNNTQLANSDIIPQGYINYLKDNLLFDELEGKIYDYSNAKPKQPYILKQQSKPGEWKPLTKEIAKGLFSGDISNMIYRETGNPDHPYNITGVPPKPEPRLKGKVSKVNKLPMGQLSQAMERELIERQIPNIVTPDVQMSGPYMVGYHDYDTQEGIDRGFRTAEERDAFVEELRKRPAGNYQPSMMNISSYYDVNKKNKKKNGGLVKYQQKGEVTYPIDLRLSQFRKPGSFFTGYGFSQNPVPNVNVHGIGAYGEGNVNDRMRLSGNVNSASVFYPGGNRMFMSPSVNVGMKYRFQGGGDISIPDLNQPVSLYKRGGGYFPPYKSYAPPRMSGGGWLEKYQDGQQVDYGMVGPELPAEYNTVGPEIPPQYQTKQPEYTESSIVDYLKSKGYDSSKPFRRDLAEEYAIEDYDFSGGKNLELLKAIQENPYLLNEIEPPSAPVDIERLVPKKKTPSPKMVDRETANAVLNVASMSFTPNYGKPKPFLGLTGSMPRTPKRKTIVSNERPEVGTAMEVDQPIITPEVTSNYFPTLPSTTRPVSKPSSKSQVAFGSTNANPTKEQTVNFKLQPLVKEFAISESTGMHPDAARQKMLGYALDKNIKIVKGKPNIIDNILSGDFINVGKDVFKKVKPAVEFVSPDLAKKGDNYFRRQELKNNDNLRETKTKLNIPVSTSKVEETPPIITGDTINIGGSGIKNRYIIPSQIDLNRTNWGVRNRGDFRPIETEGGDITLFEDFIPANVYFKSNPDSKDTDSFIGIDANGKVLTGTKKDFLNTNIPISRTFSNKIVDFPTDANGKLQLVPSSKKASNVHLSPVTTTIDDNGKLVKGKMNMLVPKKSKDTKSFGEITGGRVIFTSPDGKEKMFASGSPEDIANVFKNLKAKGNYPYLTAYTLDNGTYGPGLRTKTGKISTEDLKNYQGANTTGSVFLYLKPGQKATSTKATSQQPVSKFKDVQMTTPNVRTEKDESFKKGHSLTNEQSAVVLHHTGYSDTTGISKGMSKAMQGVKDQFSKPGESSHVVIDFDGTRYNFARPDQVTFHAGKSLLNKRENVNDFGIGIEFQGDTDNKPLTDAQIESFVEYITPIIKNKNIPLENIITHKKIRSDYMAAHPEDKQVKSKPDLNERDYERIKNVLIKKGLYKKPTAPLKKYGGWLDGYE